MIVHGRSQEAMQAGLEVFAMDMPEHKELKDVERDLDLMEQASTSCPTVLRSCVTMRTRLGEGR